MLYSVKEPEKVGPEAGRLAVEDVGEGLQLVRYCIATVRRMNNYCIEIRRNARGQMSMSVHELSTR